MVLLDWTRMGRSYCLAGVPLDDGPVRIVRPLFSRFRTAGFPNAGWSAYLLDGHSRWEVFELRGMEPAAVLEPPHTEDCWVAALRPRKRLIAREHRRSILEQTMAHRSEELFGAPLIGTRAAAYVRPVTGQRSLTTIVVAASQIKFSAVQRAGLAQADYRVTLPIPGIGARALAVKDHHLILAAERATTDRKQHEAAMQEAIQSMGPPVAVRIGLSRPFQRPDNKLEAAACWLMADGFFSLDDPQP